MYVCIVDKNSDTCEPNENVHPSVEYRWSRSSGDRGESTTTSSTGVHDDRRRRRRRLQDARDPIPCGGGV